MSRTKQTDSSDPQNWTTFILEGWRAWREAERLYGQNSRQARHAQGRYLDRKVNIETDPATRRTLARRAMELLNS